MTEVDERLIVIGEDAKKIYTRLHQEVRSINCEFFEEEKRFKLRRNVIILEALKKQIDLLLQEIEYNNNEPFPGHDLTVTQCDSVASNGSEVYYDYTLKFKQKLY